MHTITITTILLLLAIKSWAHCPYQIKLDTPYEGVNGLTDTICIDYKYNHASNAKEEFKDVMSPVFNSPKIRPSKRLYSNITIITWAPGDKTHTPVYIEEINLYPYMQMDNEHHHSTEFNFYWDTEELVYKLNNMYLVEMPGCWSIYSNLKTQLEERTPDNGIHVFNLTQCEDKRVQVHHNH